MLNVLRELCVATRINNNSIGVVRLLVVYSIDICGTTLSVHFKSVIDLPLSRFLLFTGILSPQTESELGIQMRLVERLWPNFRNNRAEGNTTTTSTNFRAQLWGGKVSLKFPQIDCKWQFSWWQIVSVLPWYNFKNIVDFFFNYYCNFCTFNNI